MKIWKKIVFMMTLICAMSSIVISGTNMTNPKGKGTVTGQGTKNYPYVLVLGEPTIDIYYTDEREEFYFKFNSGTCNSANYIVERNTDKNRIRFTLQGTGEQAIRVTSSDGLKYIQAGALCFVEYMDDASVDATDVQIPYYQINAAEEFTANKQEVTHSVELANAYLLLDGTGATMASNKSNYGTAYVFCKSGLSFKEAYAHVTEKQAVENVMMTTTAGYMVNNLPYNLYWNKSKVLYASLPKEHEDYKSKNKPEEISDDTNVNILYEFKGVTDQVRKSENSIHKAGAVVLSWIAKLLMCLGDLLVDAALKFALPDVGNDPDALEQKLDTKNATRPSDYVTVDALVFNKYIGTKVDFFGADVKVKDGNAKPVGNLIKPVINRWYKVFSTWAIILDSLFLVYIGIRSLLYTGTPNEKKIKGLFEGWLIAIGMIILMPIACKYTIKINDAMIEVLKNNNKYEIYSYYVYSDIWDDFELGEDPSTDVLNRLEKQKEKLTEEIAGKGEAVDTATEDLESAIGEYNRISRDMADLEGDIAYWKNMINERKLNIDKQIVDNLEWFSEYYKNNGFKLVDSSFGTEISFDKLADQIYEKIEEGISLGYNVYEAQEYVRSETGLSSIIVVDSSNTKDDEKTAEIQNNQINYPLYSLINDIINLNEWTGEDTAKLEDTQKQIAEKQGELDSLRDKIRGLRAEIKALQSKLDNVEKAIILVLSQQTDVMSSIRSKVGESYEFIYCVVWLILLFELLLLLFLYYKRIFMIGLLIIIFPLVAIAYGYERTTKPDSTILRNWTEEFLINVFIQMIHAIMYVTMVQASYDVFVASGEKNWLLFFLAVLGLLTSEGVAKHIVGLQGNTVSSLTRYAQSAGGALGAAAAIAKTATGARKDMKNMENSFKNREAAIQKKQAQKDGRANTARKLRDVAIRKSSKMMGAQRSRALLERARKLDAKVDKLKIKGRAAFAKGRKFKKNLKKYSRPLVKAMATVGAVSAALAAGGDVEDFYKAGKGAQTLTEVPDMPAPAADATSNVKTENEVGNVTTETSSEGAAPIEPIVPPDTEGSFDTYQAGGQSENSGGSTGDRQYQGRNANINTTQGATPPPVVPPRPPTVAEKMYRERLEEVKYHYETDVHMDEKK